MVSHPADGKTNRNLSQRHFAIFETENMSGPAEQFSKWGWGGTHLFRSVVGGEELWTLAMVYLLPTQYCLIQLQLINHFFNSLTNEKGVSNKQSATMHSSTIIFPCFIRI